MEPTEKTSPLHRAAGTNGVIEVYEDRLKILRPGGCLAGFPRGEKTILYSRLAAIEYRTAQRTAGYIQFVYSGARESKPHVLNVMKDENAVAFSRKENEQFEVIRQFIESRMV